MERVELQQNLKSNIKYKPSSFYKKTNVPSISGSSQTLKTTAVINNFYIPSGVINFSLMELQFTAVIPDAGNLLYVLMHADYFPYITRIELYSLKNKVVLLDCQDVDKYNKIINPMYRDFKRRSEGSGFFHKSGRSTANDVILTDDPVVQALATVSPNSVTKYATDVSHVEIGKDLCSVWINGPVGDGVNAGNTTVNLNLKLGDLLHDSIFSINKDIMVENLLLKITWNSIGNIYFAADANRANGIVAANNIAITNLGLNVFSQSNYEIVNNIQKRNEAGEELIIPSIDLYTQPFDQNLTAHNDGFKPVSAFANSYLYKVYSSIFITDVFAAAAATSQRQNNSSNHNTGLWTNCRFFLNNDELKSVNASLNEDYDDMAQNFKLEGTSLYNRIMVRHSGAVLTVFDSDKIDVFNEYSNDELKGISYNYQNKEISISHKWTLPVIASTKTNYYYIITLRSVYSKNGIFSLIPF